VAALVPKLLISTTYQGLANLRSKCGNRVGINSGNYPCSTSRLSR
jgi:hypothetical protein